MLAAVKDHPMSGPTVDFWQSRFDEGRTPWDRGAASPQLSRWLDDGALAPCRIVVPGCGSGYEVVRLAQAGFDVTGLDFAPAAVARTRAALQAHGAEATVIQADALEWTPPAPFDAVYEQTCLCALHPDHWIAYARQLHAWLRPGGKMFALFMQAVRPGAASGVIEGPPYHCDVNGMRALFDGGRWEWPKPPYERVPHPIGYAELPVALIRR